MSLATWTDAYVETLKGLWESGLSCAQIANEMQCGFTRNAIIGKIHRLGLNGRVYARHKMTPEQAEAARVRKVNSRREHRSKQIMISLPAKPSRPVRPEVCLEVTSRHLDLCDLGGGDCRWPYGEGPFTFCGNPILHRSYCASHYFASVGAGTSAEPAAGSVATEAVA